jgi:hypothetical protein
MLSEKYKNGGCILAKDIEENYILWFDEETGAAHPNAEDPSKQALMPAFIIKKMTLREMESNNELISPQAWTIIP